MILFNKCLKNTIKQYVLSISVTHALIAVQSLMPLTVASSKSECALLSAIFCVITLPLLWCCWTQVLTCNPSDKHKVYMVRAQIPFVGQNSLKQWSTSYFLTLKLTWILNLWLWHRSAIVEQTIQKTVTTISTQPFGPLCLITTVEQCITIEGELG